MSGIILYALIIVSQVSDFNNSDQTVAIFNSKEVCMAEAVKIIQQGPSAYCIPTSSVAEVPQEEKKLSMQIAKSF